MTKIYINPDIEKAETLPAFFYRSSNYFEDLKNKVFVKSWQFIGHSSILPINLNTYPFEFIKSYIEEPLVLVRDKNEKLKCLSNVCTHRANIIVHNKAQLKDLRCMYHGRRFDLDGKFKSMPEFKLAKEFPRNCENLKEFPVSNLGPFIFVGLEPLFDMSSVSTKIEDRISFLPLDFIEFREDLCKDYIVNSHWALYCDNYLEGFHIPFVHNDLNDVLDYEKYDTEIDEYFNVQIGYAKDGDESIFNFPKDHQDYGKRISAYYYWIFPNIMFNVYPWGISVNVVKPISKDKTKVSFLSYVYDESKLNHGAGSELDKVEREDEFVVEGVNKGLKSRYYSTGRFSPTMEKGVHHFHKLISDSLNT